MDRKAIDTTVSDFPRQWGGEERAAWRVQVMLLMAVGEHWEAD